jgi:hypothetical protein
LSQQAIPSGSFGSVRQLVDTIMHYLAQHSLNPKRYVWRAKGEKILCKIQRGWKESSCTRIRLCSLQRLRSRF